MSIKILLFPIFILCMTGNMYGQFSVDFFADKTESCAPGLIQFRYESNSPSPIVSWDWDFGDGSGSILPNAGRIYSNPGQYTICLTVTNQAGESRTVCKDDYITIFAIPVVRYTVSENTGCVPFIILFEDQTTLGDAPIVSWSWNFGDGSPSLNQANPTHTYTTAGIFDINLSVVDGNGCTDFLSTPDLVTGFESPIAAFNISDPNSCNIPHTVNFTNRSTTGSNISYQWDFGDGNQSTNMNPSHTYNQIGIFDVSLITTNTTTGCSDTSLIDNGINIGSTVDFSVSPERCVGQSITFTPETIDPNATYTWEFGDGTSITSAIANHTYLTQGCYAVTLTVTDNEGCSNADVLDCIAIDLLPTINYTLDNNSSCETPFTVNFNATGDATITEWNWDFGNQGSSDLQNPSFTFNTPGIYPISLTATNGSGCQNTIQLSDVTIQPTTFEVVTNGLSGCTPLEIDFGVNVSSLYPVAEWFWDFGDGNTSTLANPSFTYVDTGYYDVSVSITDAGGCTVTQNLADYIGVGLPIDLEISMTPPTGCANEERFFENLTPNSAIDLYFWDFGDGGSSSEENPSYFYQDTGFFDITFTADINGCISTEFISQGQYVQGPIARFETTMLCDPIRGVNFTDNSIEPDTWFWDFGVLTELSDTSIEQNPTFTFPDTGRYQVTLVVRDTITGCFHRTASPITIIEPVANFSIDTTLGCAPLVIDITDNSLSAANTTWIVNGGIINTAGTSIRYNNPGTYQGITQIVTDSNGCSDTLTLDSIIQVSGSIADFRTDNTISCDSILVTFTDASSSIIGDIVSYEWNFGDGSPISNERNPIHNYTTLGQFDVSLRVTNENGCENLLVRDNLIAATKPNVAFNKNNNGCTTEPIAFTNRSTGQGLALRFLWDFGDGNTSTLRSPTHTYDAEGVYTVCLTTTDANGCDSTLCKPSFVTIADPVAGFVADITSAICPPLEVTFTSEAQNALNWYYDFGDGTEPITGMENPVHVFTQSGVYDITQIITSVGGCRDTLIRTDYIAVNGPTGSINFPLQGGCVPYTVTIFAQGNNQTEYKYDLGDGNIIIHPSTLPFDTLVYTYTNPGNYFPALIVGNGTPSCDLGYNSPNPIIVEGLSVQQFVQNDTYCDNYRVSTSPIITPQNATVQSIVWDAPEANPNTSTDLNPSFSYLNSGTYPLSLTVSTERCTVRVDTNVLLPNTPHPVANFMDNDPLTCIPVDVRFINTSTITSGTIDTVIWNYVNGSAIDRDTVFTNFNTVDTFNISLIVSSNFGCRDTIVQPFITYPLPLADAGMPDTLCLGDTIQLRGTGGISARWFPLEELSCSTCYEPLAHPIVDTRFFIEVTNEFGCTAIDSVDIKVYQEQRPTISITQDTTVCEDAELRLTISGGLAGVTTYQWNNLPGLSCYDCPNPTVNTQVSDTLVYSVIAKNGEYCGVTDSTEITIIDTDISLQLPRDTICQGESALLSTSIGSNHFWSPNLFMDDERNPTPFVNPPTNQKYFVNVILPNGCPATDSTIISVIPLNALDAGPNKIVCRGFGVALEGFSNFPNFFWDADPTLSSTLSLNPVVNPQQSTTYYLNSIQGNCLLRDAVIVSTTSIPTITATGGTICRGDTLTLRAAGVGTSFEWSPRISLSHFDSLVTLAYPRTTTDYTVRARLDNCPTASATVTVEVLDLPEVTVDPTLFSVFRGQNIVLSGSSMDNVIARWHIQYPNNQDSILCFSCFEHDIIPDTTTTYFLEVTDRFTGCKNRGFARAEFLPVCNEELASHVPNAFTPNNDGINDYLYVRGGSALVVFRVFSRIGELVFETNDPDVGWDGKFNGQDMNPGVFVYYIESICPNDSKKVFKKGNVTLIR